MAHNTPDYRDDRWSQLATQWEKIDDLYQDLAEFKTRAKYLVRKPAESDEDYRVRVLQATVDNHLKNAVNGYSGLLSEVVTEELPESLDEYWDDVDLQGNSFEAFWLSADQATLKHGACLILTDYSQARPYWVLMPLPMIWAPAVLVENGKSYIARVAYETAVTVPDPEGFGTSTLRQFWVYEHRPARVTVWSQQESGGDLVPGETLEFRRASLGTGLGEPLQELPLTWYSITGDPLLAPGVPPFMALTNLNYLAFNKASELDAAESRGLMPTYKRMWPGSVPETPSDLFVGGVVEVPAGGDLQTLATDPSTISVAHERQKDRLEVLQRLSQAFLNGGEVERTATEVVIEASQAKLNLQIIAKRKGSAIEECLKLWAVFSDRSYRYPDPAGSVEVSRKATDVPLNAQDRAQIREDFLAGLLSAQQVLALYRSAGIIPDDLEETPSTAMGELPFDEELD